MPLPNTLETTTEPRSIGASSSVDGWDVYSGGGEAKVEPWDVTVMTFGEHRSFQSIALSLPTVAGQWGILPLQLGATANCDAWRRA